MTSGPHELEQLSREPGDRGRGGGTGLARRGRDRSSRRHAVAHLERVHALLTEWGARPAVRLAGLCHAYYGTDRFPAALGDPRRRKELTAITGAETERLVYFYASCDRRFSYPHLAKREGSFKDRFTGTVLRPPLRLRRDFAELTAANELDIVAVNPDLRAQHGQDLLRTVHLMAGPPERRSMAGRPGDLAVTGKIAADRTTVHRLTGAVAGRHQPGNGGRSTA